jgi:hypothetical protein
VLTEALVKVPLKCSECGGEALDPYCIENCRKHLCEKCGAKCFESDEDCDECVYEPESDDIPEVDVPSPEEMQEAADEFEDQFFDAGDPEDYDDQQF